jgi:hypothetical protein
MVLFFGRLYELRAVEAAGGLWSWWGRPVPGRSPSSNSFLSRRLSVWYNVYLRNNKLQFQSTDTPIIR